MQLNHGEEDPEILEKKIFLLETSFSGTEIAFFRQYFFADSVVYVAVTNGHYFACNDGDDDDDFEHYHLLRYLPRLLQLISSKKMKLMLAFFFSVTTYQSVISCIAEYRNVRRPTNRVL